MPHQLDVSSSGSQAFFPKYLFTLIRGKADEAKRREQYWNFHFMKHSKKWTSLELNNKQVSEGNEN